MADVMNFHKESILKIQSILVLGVVFLLCCVNVQAIVLYDGSDGSGDQTPDGQDWLYLADGTSAENTAAAGVTTLNTSLDTGVSAGYFSRFLLYSHPEMPTLNRLGDGYTIRFNIKIESETHNNNDRAGFSVIALSSDLEGLELAFWTDEVWAQLQPFTHGEGIQFDTARLLQYDLAVQDDSYSLYCQGTQILQGALRNYSWHSNPVYKTSDFLFFGDDTSSAGGISKLSYIEVLDYAVPEPSTLLLIGLGAVMVRRKRS